MKTQKNDRRFLILVVLITAMLLCGLSTQALAAGGGNGGNVVKSDIPAKLTWDDNAGDGVTSDGGGAYSDADSGTTCFVGRRRTITTDLSGRSSRSMTLILGTALGSIGGDPVVGTDPHGDPTGVQPPSGPSSTTIYEVECRVSTEHNVSGLGDIYDDTVRNYCPDISPDTFDDNTMCTNMRLTFYDDGGDQWRISFGPGGRANGSWPGDNFFTNPGAAPVKVQRLNPGADPKEWRVEPQIDARGVAGFLWFKGNKKNAPWTYVGAYDVRWGATAESI